MGKKQAVRECGYFGSAPDRKEIILCRNGLGGARRPVANTIAATQIDSPTQQTAKRISPGQNKMRQVRELEVTFPVRGMVHSISDMVGILEEKAGVVAG